MTTARPPLRIERIRHGAGRTDGVDRYVDPSAGPGLGLCHQVGGVIDHHHVGGAQVPRQLECRDALVRDDDPASTARHRTQHRSKSHSARADDEHALADGGGGPVDHGAKAGGHAARCQTCDIEGNVVRDFDGSPPIDDCVFGER
jgi:hypothetical protein